MHGDFHSMFGEHYDGHHHDLHLHNDSHGDDAGNPGLLHDIQQTALGGLDTVIHLLGVGLHIGHFVHDHAHLPHLHHDHTDTNQSTDLHHNADLHDSREWHDIGAMDHGSHLHMLRHSDATDSNHDGISDAASHDLGIDPKAPNDYHTVNLDWVDANGHVHHGHGKDSDGDGWADDLERLAGTDPYSAESHPYLVEAHHFPAGSDVNLPGTIDVVPHTHIWHLP